LPSVRVEGPWPPASSSRSSSRQDRAMRDIITLACSDCKRRNYNSTRNKKKTTDKLEQKKYCPSCRVHTLHKETK
jgi:large subunit ribosomal protein L33